MKLWIWSDIHLEIQEVSLPRFAPDDVDAIICAGDLCHAPDLSRRAREIVHRYDVPLIFVPGNHEFYSGRDPHRSKPLDHLAMKQAQEDSHGWNQRLYVLDDDIAEIDGVRFVGGTLWTDFEMDSFGDAEIAWRLHTASDLIPDFSQIRLGDGAPLSSAAMIAMHRLTAGFIKRELAIPFNGKTVVVTHHLPHPEATPEVHRGSDSNYLYASSETAFGGLLESANAPALWICGHTHQPVDVTVGNTRVVCNPFGYQVDPSEMANGFRWDLVIDTDAL